MAAITRIPLMFFPLSTAPRFGPRFRGLGIRLFGFYPSLRYDLRNIGLTAQPEHYCVIAFFSALIWAITISIFVAVVMAITDVPLAVKVIVPFLGMTVITMLFTVIFFIYPGTIAKSIGAQIDRELIFAMRDMLIQISSGVPLFTVIENISNSSYENVGPEFRILVTKVKGGSPLLDELENMAIRTQSEYLKKTSWQLVTSIRAGANLSSTIKSIVKTLVDYQFSLSKSFNAELNFIILIYLLVSAVLPTIGTTVMVIFSVFGLFGVSPELLTGVVCFGFVAQMGIIFYVKTKRPNLFM